MPSKRITLNDFDGRLWLSGGRDQIPDNALRIASGVAPELTRSVQSRWGSTTVAARANVISVYRYNGHRYTYDGTNLYKDNVSIQAGFTGGFLTFAQMPPQIGLPDYLFISGGGKMIKIDPSGNITNWGIAPPVLGLTASSAPQDVLIIDNMNASAGSWTPNNCTVANDSSDPYPPSTASLKVSLSGAGRWTITRNVATLDLSVYADAVISLPTDYISLWAQFDKPADITWMHINFDINDGSFSKDYFHMVVQLVTSTTDPHTAGAQLIVVPGNDQWVQLALAKSQFKRVGTNKELDWFNVQKIRVRGGNPHGVSQTILFDNFSMYGGYPLGAGPAALQNGSAYQYAVTYGNDLTGSDSNPQGMTTEADGSIAPFVPQQINGIAVQPVTLKNIPVSADAQVGNRKLWRTSAGGAVLFYLDTINDNSTTVYTDIKGDLPGQPIITTPWVAAKVIRANGYIDGGNGYYFKTTGGGTTGGTIPNWNIPTGPFLGDWKASINYQTNDWVSYLGVGYFSIVNANRNVIPLGNPGSWTALSTTVDNTVTWTWKGVNEVPHLGNTAMRFDNAPPLVSYGDMAGPYQGSMFWCRDSVVGRRGWVYSSPPGRPESVANIFQATSDDDPTQKLVVWDYGLWLITSKFAWQGLGDNPLIAFQKIKGTTGTQNPYSVCEGAQLGIYYQATDGIRMLDRSGSILPGFPNIAPIQRGQQIDGTAAPFTAIFATVARDEVIFSDGNVLFGLSRGVDGGFVWRNTVAGGVISALYYEHDTNEILAATPTAVILYEHPGAVDDSGSIISFQMQTRSLLLDEGEQACIQRFYIDANLAGQTLTPVALVDGSGIGLASITNSGRSTIEIAFQRTGRLFAVNLAGTLTMNRIEVFGIAMDIDVGAPSQ